MKFSKRLRENLVPLFAGLAVLGLYVRLAFHAYGYDWSISELFGEVVSAARASRDGYPYFSYFYNGGVYLAHDPQAWVTSPLFRILVRFTGPTASAHWLGVAYGMIGFASTYLWLRDGFDRARATYGALALSLSLGMFWRMVAGHMLFLLEMALPFFLLALTRIEKAGSPRKRALWGIALALGGAAMIYEPGFHALFYFVLPAIGFDLFLRFLLEPERSIRLIGPLIGAGILAGMIVLPKLMAWKTLPMGRTPDPTDGTLSFKDVVMALVTNRATVSGYRVPGSNPERWHFIFEVNTALMPIASVLALWGLGFGVGRRWYRERLFLLGIVCIVFSLLAAGNPMVWKAMQALTSGGIRVPSRYLGLGAFGLMILSVYGLTAIGAKIRSGAKWVPLSAGLLVLIFAATWLKRAEKSRALNDTASAMVDRSTPSGVYRVGRYCPVGSGCLNTYQAGYGDDPYIRFLEANRITEANFRDWIPPKATVRTTEIILAEIDPAQVIDLPFRPSALGEEVSLLPNEARPVVSVHDGHLRVTGDPARRIERMEIRPNRPAPTWALWFAGIGLMIAILTGIFLLFTTAKDPETAA
jgi:hypothetical protein